MRAVRARVALLAGIESLVAGIFPLAEHPLLDVLMMLGSMAWDGLPSLLSGQTLQGATEEK